MAAMGELSVGASGSNPGGRRSTWSPWLIQTVRSTPLGRGEERVCGRPGHRAAVLPFVGVLTAAELVRHELQPVADAEHRDAELEEARVDARGAGSNTLGGPPERMIPSA